MYNDHRDKRTEGHVDIRRGHRVGGGGLDLSGKQIRQLEARGWEKTKPRRDAWRRPGRTEHAAYKKREERRMVDEYK